MTDLAEISEVLQFICLDNHAKKNMKITYFTLDCNINLRRELSLNFGLKPIITKTKFVFAAAILY